MLLSLVIIYNYVLFCFRSNIIFHYIILYDLQYSDLFVYLIRDPPHITDNMISLDGYDVFRRDRSSNGGRVCIYLRSSIKNEIRKDLVPPELEAVCVEIIKPHSKPFLVTPVYRPPSSLPEVFDDFVKLIKAINNENKEMYILGDLNCNMLKTDKDANIPTKKIDSLYELYQLTK